MDYIVSDTDAMAEKMILHVMGPIEVRLYSQLDEDREREAIAIVKAGLPDFAFGHFLSHEEFCIALQSKFIDNADRQKLLKFAGTVEAGSIAQYSDDGVSQKATVKTGIVGKQDDIVPGVVTLQPYRTFLNIEQPESQFIFRMRDGAKGVECAIFEADGGAWKNTARAAIHEYLEESIDEAAKQRPTIKNQFIVIS